MNALKSMHLTRQGEGSGYGQVGSYAGFTLPCLRITPTRSLVTRQPLPPLRTQHPSAEVNSTPR